MKPAVSVLIANRNYGRFLAAAIESVRAQTFTDWELVLIDDGSTDDSVAVASRFADDPRIRIVRSDGLGQSRAKNLALRLSRAPLVAYLDGDDLWLPAKLERQVALFRENPALGVVYSRRCLIDEAGGPLPTPQPPLVRGHAFGRFVVSNPVCFSSVMVRRDVLEHVGSFEPRIDLAVDYDLWLRVSRHHAFDYVDEVLVKYRTGHANLSKRLTERVTTVLSVMRRCLVRRGNEAHVPAGQLREAWGSTCRSMAYAVRDGSSVAAAKWYVRAAARDRRVGASLRAVAGLSVRALARLVRR